MALFTFYQIFRLVDDKTLEFVHKTKVGGVEFDAGEQITRGLIIGGIDFFRYLGHEIEADKEEDGTLVIQKVYV